MRGQNTTKKYAAAVRAAADELVGAYSKDYRAGVIATLDWMLLKTDTKPIAVGKPDNNSPILPSIVRAVPKPSARKI